MRWDEQRVENDLRLPGVGDGTVVRTFDAPEAMGINFHEVRARSALNHVPGGRYGFNWTINPYRGCTHACVFCFARSTHTYLDFDAGRDFEREIVVKVNVPELLRAELARPSWKRELVALGTNTDPYQWVESRYRMMPEILAALEEAETPVSVLTKSPLVMRDVEIFERMAESGCRSRSTSRCRPSTRRPGGRPSRTRRARAPASTPSPSCAAAASTPGVLIAPLMPGINDDARAGPADRRPRPRGRRHLPRRRRPPPARRGPRRLLRLARGKTPRPAPTLREALRRRPRLHAPPATESAPAQGGPRLGVDGRGREESRWKASATTQPPQPTGDPQREPKARESEGRRLAVRSA